MSEEYLVAIMLGVIIGFSVSCLIDVVWSAYIMRKKALEESDKEVFKK